MVEFWAESLLTFLGSTTTFWTGWTQGHLLFWVLCPSLLEYQGMNLFKPIYNNKQWRSTTISNGNYYLIAIIYLYGLFKITIKLLSSWIWVQWYIKNYDHFYHFAKFYVIMCLTRFLNAKTDFQSRCLKYAWVHMYPPLY